MYCPRKTFLMLVGTLAVLIVIEIDAIPTPKSCLAYLKDLALEKFKAGLAQTSVVSEFRDAVGRIKEKYERAAEEGRFNITNEDEAAKYYYQIAVEEVKLMKQTGSLAEKMSHVGDIEEVDDFTDVACARADIAGDEVSDYDLMDMDLDMDMEDTGAERLELENELDRLNHELESEMGWSMSPEAKANMHKQAKKLAGEVLQNEVRDLALAAVTGFMTGGVGGAVGPVWTIVSASLKLKVVRYFAQMILDILSSYLGQSITLDEHSSPEMDLKGTPQINAAIPVAA